MVRSYLRSGVAGALEDDIGKGSEDMCTHSFTSPLRTA